MCQGNGSTNNSVHISNLGTGIQNTQIFNQEKASRSCKHHTVTTYSFCTFCARLCPILPRSVDDFISRHFVKQSVVCVSNLCLLRDRKELCRWSLASIKHTPTRNRFPAVMTIQFAANDGACSTCSVTEKGILARCRCPWLMVILILMPRYHKAVSSTCVFAQVLRPVHYRQHGYRSCAVELDGKYEANMLNV
jgi:hypothetical protein